MTEEQKQEQGEQPQEQPQEKKQPQVRETESIIGKADGVATRLEEANKRSEELLQRQEAIAARMTLSGKADAGQEPQKTPEQIRDEAITQEVNDALSQFG